MNQTTVKSHTRRTGKRTGIPQPKPKHDPEKEFWLDRKKERTMETIACPICGNEVDGCPSAIEDNTLRYDCEFCGHRVYRPKPVSNIAVYLFLIIASLFIIGAAIMGVAHNGI